MLCLAIRSLRWSYMEMQNAEKLKIETSASTWLHNHAQRWHAHMYVLYIVLYIIYLYYIYIHNTHKYILKYSVVKCFFGFKG